MGYAATKGFILYWNPDQLFVIHRYQNVWFDEYNSRLSIEDRCIPFIYSFVNIMKVLFIIKSSSNLFHVYLILNPIHFAIQQLSHMKLSYLPLERELVLIYWMMNILQSYISLIKPQIHQPVTNFQYRLKKKWIISINVEDPITAQGAIDKLNLYQTPREKPKVNIILRKRNS